MSVPTNALPLAGTVISLALYKSCPAAYVLPFVGTVALSLRRMTCNCCSALAAAAIDGAMGAGGCSAAIFVALARLLCAFAKGVGVAVPESVPRWRVDAWESGEGSITFVRLGSGEFGRDGGSCAGAGVDVDIFVVWWWWWWVPEGGGEGGMAREGQDRVGAWWGSSDASARAACESVS
jgi:hypothetical protein